jgi:hypothetical protein
MLLFKKYVQKTFLNKNNACIFALKLKQINKSNLFLKINHFLKQPSIYI